MLTFTNRFRNQLPGEPESIQGARQVYGHLWSPVLPTPVVQPRILACSHDMLATLGLNSSILQDPKWAQVLGGNMHLDGMQPYASCYGGHQFGHWAGQLGDGRAIVLGEVQNAQGEYWEVQLKGAGPTPYSRRGDGRAVLRSSIREFLCSEAMHHLGIPSTRALSLVATGESVIRDMFYDGHPQAEPGAVVCRIAPSFIRFGHFELPKKRNDINLLRQLIDFTIKNYFKTELKAEERLSAWFGKVCELSAKLVAEWMRVGFVHGVLNTDNMSILGLTIDYGPYGWVEDFDPNWTPNTTDAEGRRYCYGRQPDIVRWNLERLAEALHWENPAADLDAGLVLYDNTYTAEISRIFAGKLGLSDFRSGDADLINDLFTLMYQAELDMTDFFWRLSEADYAELSSGYFKGSSYRSQVWERYTDQMEHWLSRYRVRLQQQALPDTARKIRMHQFNPRYVLRNYLAQQVIEEVEQGSTNGLLKLMEVLRHPYTEQPGQEQFAALRPEWARQKPGCATLSCSS